MKHIFFGAQFAAVFMLAMESVLLIFFGSVWFGIWIFAPNLLPFPWWMFGYSSALVFGVSNVLGVVVALASASEASAQEQTKW